MTLFKTNNSKSNLCDTCKNCISSCEGFMLEFGDAKGDDNVIECNGYDPADTLPDGVEMFND